MTEISYILILVGLNNPITFGPNGWDKVGEQPWKVGGVGSTRPPTFFNHFRP